MSQQVSLKPVAVAYFAHDGKTIIDTECMPLSDLQLRAIAAEPGLFMLEDEVGCYKLRSADVAGPIIEMVLQ